MIFCCLYVTVSERGCIGLVTIVKGFLTKIDFDYVCKKISSFVGVRSYLRLICCLLSFYNLHSSRIVIFIHKYIWEILLLPWMSACLFVRWSVSKCVFTISIWRQKGFSPKLNPHVDNLQNRYYGPSGSRSMSPLYVKDVNIDFLSDWIPP